MRGQGLNVIDVENALDEHKGEYIYYRTDHHYTSLGAYYCYAEYRKAINQSVRNLSNFTAEKLCGDFLGTSCNKVNFPMIKADEITAYYIAKNRSVSYNFDNYKTNEIYERKFLKTKDQYAVFLNSNQSQTVIEGSGEGKLLIVKDSFGNTFAQFPCEDYAEVHIIDPRFFRGSISKYAAENGIDEVCAVYGLQNFSNDVKLIII